MKKCFTLVIALVLLLSGCTTSVDQNTTSTQPQVYTASSPGRNGNVSVEVTIDGEKISNVVVTNHEETPGISDPAIEQIPEAIVEEQSINVDVITGVTLTSDAILNAVKDCLNQANLDLNNYSAKKENELTEQTLDTDVLVIGGGGAGLSAAIEAANQGADVILLEKTSELGGSTKLSMGMVVRGPLEGEDESAMTNNEYLTQLKNYSVNNPYVRTDIQEDFVAHIDENAQWLLDQGFDAKPYLYKGWAPMDPSGDWTNDATSAYVLVNDAAPEYGKGIYIINALESAAEEAGVTIMRNTAGTSLIVDENNAVIGANAHASDTNTDYIINANAIVLATGSFGGDPEWFNAYSELSGLENGLGPYNGGAGNTADGINMAIEIGADSGMYFTNLAATEEITNDTTGGLIIDEETRVLDVEGQPIENLYAVGEMTDLVIMGDTYIMCGTYNSWSIYTGRIAGANAATK